MRDHTMTAQRYMTMAEWEAKCERRDRLTFGLGIALGGFAGSFVALLVLCWLI